MRAVLIGLAIVGCAPLETGDVVLIPAPSELAVDPGFLAPETLSADDDAVGALVAEQLGLALVAGGGDVELRLAGGLGLGREGYTLTIDAKGATVVAEEPAGLFYGAQTLRQLPDPWPRVRITDVPRFPWRGYMLDVARHFFGPEELRRAVDLASFHKLNRLHLHLTDDQGWRIELESWPDLTAIGGATEVGGGAGGFLTRAEYEALVDYAAARFVTIVPEIDLPGHVNAALASYPELNEDGVAAEPYTGTSVGFSALCLSCEATWPFVTDVLAEVAAMTPGGWLHVGGDEAYETPPEDYAAFMLQLRDFVRDDLGKTVIAWEEAGAAPLGGDFVAQVWRDEAGADAARAQGAALIQSPAEHAYLDMKYDLETGPGTVWAGLTDVRDAYDWDPGDDALGVEAPLWTEFVETRADIDLLTWPRLAGIAEIGWSPAGREWDEYRQRLAVHGQRLDALDVGYYRSPLVDW